MIMKLNNIIKKVLKEQYTKLGKGAMGSVYEKENRVFKITEDEDEVVVSKGLMNSKKTFKHFPEIYSIQKMGKNDYGEDRFGIIRKKYLPLKEMTHLSDVIDLIKKYRSEIMSYIANQKNILPIEVKENKKLYETINGIIQEFSTLNLPDYKLLDFHLNNLGIDEKGNIVLFDF